jgi:hypothetical protein
LAAVVDWTYVQSMLASPTPVQTLLDLFVSHLADVRFPDVDASTLACHAAAVELAEGEVAAAQAALDAARGLLQERQDALLQHAVRAQAYARVFAAEDTALLDQIDAIALPRVGRRREGAQESASASFELTPPRRRGRPRKEETPELTALGERDANAAE